MHRVRQKIFIEQDTSSTQTSTDNITKTDISVDTKDLAKKGDTNNISLQSPGNVLETTKTSSEVWDPITKESTNNPVNCSASAAQDATNFIRIVENITTNNSKPRNPVTIKREKTKYLLRRLTSNIHTLFLEGE